MYDKQANEILRCFFIYDIWFWKHWLLFTWHTLCWWSWLFFSNPHERVHDALKIVPHLIWAFNVDNVMTIINFGVDKSLLSKFHKQSKISTIFFLDGVAQYDLTINIWLIMQSVDQSVMKMKSMQIVASLILKEKKITIYFPLKAILP